MEVVAGKVNSWSIDGAGRVRETFEMGLAIDVSIWGVSALPLGTYIVAQRLSIPLQVQPHAFGVLSMVSVGQCLYYGRQWSLRRTLLVLGAFVIFWAGFETGSIYAVWVGVELTPNPSCADSFTGRTRQRHGCSNAAVRLLVCGLAGRGAAVGATYSFLPTWLTVRPQYWEIYRLGEVVGVSMLFMGIDIIGGIFSLLSLIFRPDFDVAAGVSGMGYPSDSLLTGRSRTVS